MQSTSFLKQDTNLYKIRLHFFKMKRRLIALSAVILIFFISLTSALTIEKTKIGNTIISEFNQPAKFTLSVSSALEGNYNIYTLSDVKILPPTAQISFSKTFNIYIYPTENLNVRGFYTFTYALNGPEKYEDKLTIEIVDLKDAVEISSEEFESGKINFYIKNKEDIELENIKVKFSSIFFDNIEKTITLKPNQITEISVDVDKEKLKTILAGSYIVNAEFQTDKGPVKIEGKIYLGEKKGIKKQEDSSGFLINTKTITKINTGNIPQTVEIEIKKDIISRLFTSFNNEPDLIERNGFAITYMWAEELKPAEILTIKAKTNFIFPFLIIIFAALIILAFKHYTQTKVEIKKSVHHVKTKSGQFALKVKLNIKAKKSVENVSLIDKIPAMLKVYNKFGTLKPTKFDVKNRRLQWDLNNLNSGEERVFSYIIYSKIGVMGKFSLPPAAAMFEINNEIHETESNAVFFLSEQTEKEED